MQHPWKIQLLGALKLTQQERVITRFRTQKTGALLAYLAYHQRKSHPREILIELFWPETTPESGRHNLSHALSSLRSLLEPPGVPAGTVLIADRFTVELNPDAIHTDVQEFENALRDAAKARNTPQYTALLATASEKYTGELLPGYYEDWIQPAQEHLNQRVQQATQELQRLQERQSNIVEPRPSRAAPPAALPTGTVTFLFTDIEALNTHHALLRQEFNCRGGHEVKEAADSFLIAFGSVADALACAIAMQRALAKQLWPDETGPLRVRMALHTGDVELEAGEYHGLMLHRAARMLSAAHGGQVLCSEASANLLVRDLEPQVSLKDLGLWRLRDIQEPERLFQVSYPDMPLAEFPPLNASPAHSAHLPLQFTRFFGRETEIAQLITLLLEPQTRLLTLTGTGGTGKTRLAIEAAGALAGAVWFVPLADLSTPSLIPTSILQALSIPLSGSTDPLEQAIAALQKQPTLLLLDNFEQLIEAGGAELVQSLLSRVDSLRCLVTSRQLLGLPGEVEFAVGPLATPNGSDTPERLGMFESVRLFVDRAQAAKPDFRVTNGNAPAVAELCDRLEGIPLAIELAAARALVLTPSQMLAQLGNRFEFLVSRKRGLAERQRTLRAAIDWSYRLLTPDVQRFFCQLCVFRGGWSLEAAESVCDEPLALDMLAQLRECSLITTVESTEGIRFRMLEMLREYAQSRLSPEELATLRQRHSIFYLAQAEKAEPLLRGADAVRWLQQLEEEHDNLRAVLAWSDEPGGDGFVGLQLAGALDHFWSLRGYVTESREYLARALEREPKERGAARARALRGLANRGESAGVNGGREELYQESLAIYQELGDQHSVAALLLLLGALYQTRGAYGAAREIYEKSLAISRGVGFSAGIANALYKRGQIAQLQGDYASALTDYQESLALRRELGDLRSIYLSLNNLGALAVDRGDSVAARKFYEESLATARTLGDSWGIAAILSSLGSVARDQGDHATARELLEESLALFQESGYQPGIAGALRDLAGVAHSEDNLESARDLYAKSLLLLRDLGLRLATIKCLRSMAALRPPLRGALLWGAAEHLQEEIGYSPTPMAQAHHEKEVAAAREALGDVAFERAWQEGRAMTLEQAVDYALASPLR